MRLRCADEKVGFGLWGDCFLDGMVIGGLRAVDSGWLYCGVAAVSVF